MKRHLLNRSESQEPVIMIFAEGTVLRPKSWFSQGEKYSDLVENIHPAVLIEVDCRSIGGAWQMCITHVNPDIREGIKSIVIEEFKGIDKVELDLSKIKEDIDEKSINNRRE